MRGWVAISLLLAACSEETTPGESTGDVAETGDDAASDPSNDASSSSSSTTLPPPSTSDAEDSDDSNADSSPPADVPPYVGFSEVQALFDAFCVTDCHQSAGTYPMLDLSDYARNELILVASNGSSLFYVVSGDHETSYLWHKVNGSQGSVGGMGSRMPEGGPVLMQAEIDLVANWIDNGAPP